MLHIALNRGSSQLKKYRAINQDEFPPVNEILPTAMYRMINLVLYVIDRCCRHDFGFDLAPIRNSRLLSFARMILRFQSESEIFLRFARARAGACQLRRAGATGSRNNCH
jgi:hypothetical protein